MTTFIRKLVSKKKRRFITNEEGGFNLDLSYINDKVIAMGFPSQGKESLYRNKMSDVVRFLDWKHKDHYKVYNLCSERSYDSKCFHDRVETFPFDDHNAPPIELFEKFCKDADNYLKADSQNIVVTHCKAGKGRTGVMICAYLLYSKAFNTADEAFEFYGTARTYNSKGVTIPSQRRYVRYFEQLLVNNLQYVPVRLELTKITLSPPPIIGEKFFFVLESHREEVYRSEEATLTRPANELVLLPSKAKPTIEGDIKLLIFTKMGLNEKPKKILHTWFNTFFIKDGKLTLARDEIEGAYKDKKQKVFAEPFNLIVEFSNAEGALLLPIESLTNEL